MPNYGGESSGPSDYGGGNYGSGYDRSSRTGESGYNPNNSGNQQMYTQPIKAPQAPIENPLFAQARMQAVNDMMGGWGQGYQQPQMNPMQMYGGGQPQMNPFSMFGGPNTGFDWGNYFGTFGGK